MVWTIEFDDKAAKAFGKLDRGTKKQISDYLKNRVSSSPFSFGKALTADKKGLWRYRVGDYRIVTSIEEKKMIVLVC